MGGTPAWLVSSGKRVSATLLTSPPLKASEVLRVEGKGHEHFTRTTAEMTDGEEKQQPTHIAQFIEQAAMGATPARSCARPVGKGIEAGRDSKGVGSAA